MTKENIYSILNEIDDDIISQATIEKHTSKKRIIISLGSIAAAIAVVITGGILYKAENAFPIKLIDKNPQYTLELHPYIKWEDRAIYQQYAEFELNTGVYDSFGGIVTDNMLGDFITDTKIKGYDFLKDKNYSIEGALYSIKNISSEYVVAVKLDGTAKIYSYKCSTKYPATLGEFIDALDLPNNLIINSAYSQYIKPLSNKNIDICYENINEQKIFDILNKARDAKNVYDETNPELMDLYSKENALDFSIDIPLLGYKNISLAITSDGYLKTNILDTAKVFFVGEENSKAIIDYVKNNCTGYEIVYKFVEETEE